MGVWCSGLDCTVKLSYIGYVEGQQSGREERDSTTVRVTGLAVELGLGPFVQETQTGVGVGCVTSITTYICYIHPKFQLCF